MKVIPNSAAAMRLLILLHFHSWDSEFINQILIFAFVLKCPGREIRPSPASRAGSPAAPAGSVSRHRAALSSRSSIRRLLITLAIPSLFFSL